MWDTVLGAKEVRGNAVVPVVDALVQRIIREQRLTATKSEMDDFAQSFGMRDEDLRNMSDHDRAIAKIKAETWKAHAWLYKQHGGRVVSNIMDEQLPLDAIRMQIEQDEKAGNIQFFSASARESVFAYFGTDFDSFVPADEVNFTTPPWKN